MEKEIIDAIEKVLGYEFNDKALIVQAFTRESYAKEQRVKGIDSQSNEQLEYFGDSVLNYLVVIGQLDHFTKVMENTGLHVLYKEGKLSEFNSHWTDKKMLSSCIDTLDLAKYLIMSKGDIIQEAAKNPSVKEDLFESLVGAMWIDSNKDISKIQDVVYNMLNIQFDAANVEKNYVSKLMEYADKNKFLLESEVTPIENGFEVKYTITLDLSFKDDREWFSTGVGKNIKEAEQEAAKKLLSILEHYNFAHADKLPNKEYTLDNSINVLQELNKQEYIGEISYEDQMEFSSDKKPYWKVICKVTNFSMLFSGTGESKKEAKKNAALNALVFIYSNINKTNEYNPAHKHFKFLVNLAGGESKFKVFVIDNMTDFVYTGHVFPDNKQLSYFAVNDTFEDENGNMINTYDDPIEGIIEWHKFNGTTVNDETSFKLYLQNEYNKLQDDIKNNGLELRNKMEEIVTRYI